MVILGVIKVVDKCWTKILPEMVVGSWKWRPESGFEVVGDGDEEKIEYFCQITCKITHYITKFEFR